MNPSLFTSVLNHYLPEPHASLLNGILFGIPLKTSSEFYQQLRTVGLLHLVVLSGMNITLLSAIIANLTGFLNKKVSLLVSIVCIIGFILFVGPSASIIRAGVMGILVLWGVYLGKPTIALYSLLISLIFIALIWPQWLNTISLQLSYGATIGLLLFGKGKSNLSKKNNVGKFIHAVYQEFRISLAAQVFTAPLILFHFRQLSIVSPLANVVVSFIIGPLMIMGFLTAVLGRINFVLGLLPSLICFSLLQYIILVTSLLSSVPFAILQW